jgi:hypothetical protein
VTFKRSEFGAFGCRRNPNAGEEHRPAITAGIGAPLAAEQSHKFIMLRAMIAAEPCGQGPHIEVFTATASRVPAFLHKGIGSQQSDRQWFLGKVRRPV